MTFRSTSRAYVQDDEQADKEMPEPRQYRAA